ncbi:Assimilatory nitrate reductase (NADH) beta subunit [Candidatus Filomicrobium marinum]|uniref:Assimilatory nitrate reductase (NADH) beta subunit n=1 Tax=Candidatus Filomicrobium marinum TaxID=1608628 RepID=A0A0D6JDU5_9HYPH|nr:MULTISPECIES: FAD-dependent oxidoreductase [Filomicrobium]MCV0368070.1 FAD-dependent oxidoreductase [Filomicrobium sp.]CFX15207.1 Assimilatory nitrate reductase (NADH) beta subunit [Candidatus Filomicrobium marinum]CPR17920.1 Assimilatory nitrate reductase (NADH) beta subunit [Candidatus Filomicrobium marinum]
MRKRIAVVGNGMAGLRFVEELVAAAPGQFDITVIGAEPQPAYNRVLLSPLLAGEIGLEDVSLKPADWYAAHGVTLLTGAPVTVLDTYNRSIIVENADGGMEIYFDACVLATGSNPIRLTLPGDTLDGVLTFRTTADVDAMSQFAQIGQPAVVIGGGLLGIEAAYGLARAGIPVTLVHIMDRLMERQLDPEGALYLKGALEAKGIRVILGAQTKEILGETRVESVILSDGQKIDCGLVVMAVGVQANTKLAVSAGLVIGRGIIVDEGLQTTAPNIFAIGECAEYRGICHGLVEPAYEQAKVLADCFAGRTSAYGGSVPAANLKVSGVPVFSVGNFSGDDAEVLVTRDAGLETYRKLCVREGQLVGAVLVGDTTDALWYLDLIRSGADITAFRDSLAFGRAYAEAA